MTAGQESVMAGANNTPATVRRFTAQQKQAILQAYGEWPGHMQEFCAAQGVSTTSLCEWRRKYQAHGAQGLEAQRGVSRTRHHGPYPPAARQQAVEAYRKSGMALDEFAKVWRVTPHSRGRGGGSKWGR